MPGARGPVPVPAQANGTSDLTSNILHSLEQHPQLDTQEAFPQTSQAEIKAALDRLASRRMVAYEAKDKELVVLTEEGQQISDEGSHEWKVWEAVKSKGRIPIKEIEKIVGPSAKVGQGNAFKLKWIKKDGDALVPVAENVTDTTRELLQHVGAHHEFPDPKQLKDYQKRKLVTTKKDITYTVRKGAKWALQIPVEVTDLTVEMLQDGSWESANFKPYNFQAAGEPQHAGALHPLNKVREEFRKIFFSQDFIEMPTGRFVDSGFWNFDALFVPQQHPARDLQDTFYVSDPAEAGEPGPDPAADAALTEMEADSQMYTHPDGADSTKLNYAQYVKNVRAVHQDGAFGSTGYRYPYSDAETRRLVMRTHTTAVSAYCLHRLASNPRPARYFSIDRVFRNESVDATHLAEFHQIEGVIADYGLTLGGLMDFLGKFFTKLGISDLRFKPAYNPYTEPSMEVFGYHHGLAKWVEIGNSGMFRPEMLLAMGLPEGLRCYGFGLSLERPTMIKYGVNNIRKLLGHKVDVGFIESNAAVRLDKD
ncbi:tRNA synthetases class II core domain (F)-domain-containing protein [Neohortaea acidophila]|uniref:phenylalanine--tRNA ligase n=1 Tax=Neohortaea acidophila TaxID=245834 RepID=A0A6A6PLS3_9PEZI|nr:tRNA synthetases class II core domain (F)-domain-containing protein [Neohortaea acidophila]KAF2480413.1 tRNA synthetases class II core domain (F)-domain-containing protein [Neohortaea acidophila]